jgi:hypothetical protein
LLHACCAPASSRQQTKLEVCQLYVMTTNACLCMKSLFQCSGVQTNSVVVSAARITTASLLPALFELKAACSMSKPSTCTPPTRQPPCYCKPCVRPLLAITAAHFGWQLLSSTAKWTQNRPALQQCQDARQASTASSILIIDDAQCCCLFSCAAVQQGSHRAQRLKLLHR